MEYVSSTPIFTWRAVARLPFTKRNGMGLWRLMEMGHEKSVEVGARAGRVTARVAPRTRSPL
jgi:hypothetical protein